MHSDEDYIYGRRHNDDREIGSVGDVSAGSGRSQDILRVSTARDPVPFASPAPSDRTTGGHALVNKDCCRSVACEANVPVAVIVEVVPPGVERVYWKQGADP